MAVRVIVHLQPLAVATNVIQGSNTRLDHVVLTLAYLYKLFMNPLMEDEVRVGILKSLDKRWSKNVDHDVFLMALILNPYIRSQAFRPGNPQLVAASLYNMADRVYTRVLESRPDAGFRAAFWNYLEYANEFTVERMQLKQYEADFQAEVRV